MVEAKIEKRKREKETKLLKSNLISKLNESCGILAHPGSPNTHSHKEDKMRYAFALPAKFQIFANIGKCMSVPNEFMKKFCDRIT